MESLRTRRSQAPARKPQRQGTKLAKPGAGPTPRGNKSRVDDKIKKRMSMRYADISSPTELDVPVVPSVPVVLMPAGRGRQQDEVVKDRTRTVEDTRLDDNKFLDQDDFDAEACMCVLLQVSYLPHLYSRHKDQNG